MAKYPAATSLGNPTSLIHRSSMNFSEANSSMGFTRPTASSLTLPGKSTEPDPQMLSQFRPYSIVMVQHGNISRRSRLSFLIRKGSPMRLTSLGLAAALTLASTFALAQSGTGSAGASSTTGAPATGTTTGSSINGTTTGSSTTGMPSNAAGSAAAGANSALNPSGNSAINPSPSGSTLTPAPGAGR